MVAGMVTVGGLTRLTKSGLSMTDWRVQGSLPPMNEAEWEAEFARYKTFPEWQQRQKMTLDEFKFIFYWEWGHRMLGRTVGLAFTGPLLVFAARGMIPRHMYGRLATLFALGGTQGLIGWWMVKSGLEMDPKQRKEIRVSPYRLATHLGMAFTTYSLLLWTALDVFNPAESVKKLTASVSPSALPKISTVRLGAAASAAVVFTTALSGAFVAGNDAGHAFNTWPLMDESFVPDDLVKMEPRWRNFFENTATVQFDHRMLAYSSAAAVASTYALARRGNVWALLPQQSRNALNASIGMVGVQISLGISTLLLYVPIELAAAHQAGSLVLLSFVTWSLHSLRFAQLSTAAMTGAAACAAAVGAAGAHVTGVPLPVVSGLAE